MDELSNEELVKEIQAGEKGRLADLYLCNKGFISMMAKKYGGMAEEEDLMQEGYIGLQVAAERFDTALGVPFISYAADWIRQGMQRCVNSTGNIKIPEYTLNDLRKYRKIYTEITSCTGREPNDEEVAAARRKVAARVADHALDEFDALVGVEVFVVHRFVFFSGCGNCIRRRSRTDTRRATGRCSAPIRR